MSDRPRHQPRPKIPFETALEIADAANLEGGAWMAMLEELTGLDAGDVCTLLEHDLLRALEAEPVEPGFHGVTVSSGGVPGFRLGEGDDCTVAPASVPAAPVEPGRVAGEWAGEESFGYCRRASVTVLQDVALVCPTDSATRWGWDAAGERGTGTDVADCQRQADAALRAAGWVLR